VLEGCQELEGSQVFHGDMQPHRHRHPRACISTSTFVAATRCQLWAPRPHSSRAAPRAPWCSECFAHLAPCAPPHVPALSFQQAARLLPSAARCGSRKTATAATATVGQDLMTASHSQEAPSSCWTRSASSCWTRSASSCWTRSASRP